MTKKRLHWKAVRESFPGSEAVPRDVMLELKKVPPRSQGASRTDKFPSIFGGKGARGACQPDNRISPRGSSSGRRSVLDTYEGIAEIVCNKLGLDDPSKVKLSSYDCFHGMLYLRQIMYGAMKLSEMLVHDNQISNILYYEVLDNPLPELDSSRTLKFAFHSAVTDEVADFCETLPKYTKVGELLAKLKAKVKLSHPNARRRLLYVPNHQISVVFRQKDTIDYVSCYKGPLRVEEIPEEEENSGSCDCLIRVCHFDKHSLKCFENPFLFIIHKGETLAEIKVRLQKKLNVANKEFVKWTSAFFQFDIPEYLIDSDIVASYFKKSDRFAASSEYLGLVHSHRTHNRVHEANQSAKVSRYSRYSITTLVTMSPNLAELSYI
ncbi:ubiquitin C-terminal hydrolase 12-like [Telopea speciosissima]|uniref:ubiquitin C-terminal hydrolase 12-like n=1 Tax=Telopea speciosissima TaxID=54955 RepID=UPI001CC645F1|nr:ubiquitin C-terminal hydrolase 12-like [Telopea speciosissima]